LATEGTVKSESYVIELQKFAPDLAVTQHACPMWVPLIENNQHQSPGGQFFIQQDLLQLLEKDPKIDTILLGCTHYPIVKAQIEAALPEHIRVIAQGSIVAASLADYLIRHPEMDDRCSKGGNVRYWTTENAQAFSEKASALMQMPIQAEHIHL
jgi:glutamate racemase